MKLNNGSTINIVEGNAIFKERGEDMTSRIIEQIISVVANIDNVKYSEDELRREQINKMERIKLLQRNLANIRVIAGINASSIANVLGLSKQAISNWELMKTEMSYSQYLAVCMLLIESLKNNPNNIVLQKVVEIIIVNAEKIQIAETATIENILAALASVKKIEDKQKEVDEGFLSYLLDKLNFLNEKH